MSSRWLVASAVAALTAAPACVPCPSRSTFEAVRASTCVELETEVVRDLVKGDIDQETARERVRLYRRLCDRLHERMKAATGGDEE